MVPVLFSGDNFRLPKVNSNSLPLPSRKSWRKVKCNPRYDTQSDVLLSVARMLPEFAGSPEPNRKPSCYFLQKLILIERSFLFRCCAIGPPRTWAAFLRERHVCDVSYQFFKFYQNLVLFSNQRFLYFSQSASRLMNYGRILQFNFFFFSCYIPSNPPPSTPNGYLSAADGRATGGSRSRRSSCVHQLEATNSQTSAATPAERSRSRSYNSSSNGLNARYTQKVLCYNALMS